MDKYKGVKVCVTGGAGYLASSLVNHLLRGATLFTPLFEPYPMIQKVGLLKNLRHAETRLKLFQADIYRPREFAAAIDGCDFVFHLATVYQHYQGNSQYKNSSEATVAAVKMIAESCIKSYTVKKLVYTATVLAASPLKGDASGYEEVMDETCWTPLNLPNDVYKDYIPSKTLAEREALSYNEKGIQVVSLATGLVGGDTILSVPESVSILTAQALSGEFWYKGLRSLEDLVSKVPIVHVNDVIEAHIFAIENSDVNGRFLLASSFLKSAEIASLIQKHHPDITIPPEFIEDTKRETRWGSRKLEDVGFEYKCDAHKIIDDSIVCAKRFGNIVRA